MHKRGALPEFTTGVLSQHYVARVKMADGHMGKRSEDEQDRAKKKVDHPSTNRYLPQSSWDSTPPLSKAHCEHERDTVSKKCTSPKILLVSTNKYLQSQLMKFNACRPPLCRRRRHTANTRGTLHNLTKKDALFLHDLRPVLQQKSPLQKHTLQKLEKCVTR